LFLVFSGDYIGSPAGANGKTGIGFFVGFIEFSERRFARFGRDRDREV
jgi:hypothetical protein